MIISCWMVLSVCEDILCQAFNEISATDKDILIEAIAKYTIMKRQYDVQEKTAKNKSKNNMDR